MHKEGRCGWARVLTTQDESGEATNEHLQPPDFSDSKQRAQANSLPADGGAEKRATPQGDQEGGDDALEMPRGPVSHPNGNSRAQSSGSGSVEPVSDTSMSDR